MPPSTLRKLVGSTLFSTLLGHAAHYGCNLSLNGPYVVGTPVMGQASLQFAFDPRTCPTCETLFLASVSGSQSIGMVRHSVSDSKSIAFVPLPAGSKEVPDVVFHLCVLPQGSEALVRLQPVKGKNVIFVEPRP